MARLIQTFSFFRKKKFRIWQDPPALKSSKNTISDGHITQCLRPSSSFSFLLFPLLQFMWTLLCFLHFRICPKIGSCLAISSSVGLCFVPLYMVWNFRWWHAASPQKFASNTVLHVILLYNNKRGLFAYHMEFYFSWNWSYGPDNAANLTVTVPLIRDSA